MSNMFECVLKSNGGGGGNTLLVSCTSVFAGATITCTDGGSNTLTAVCPSTSPYDVSFNLPSDGTWTVSATIQGETVSDSVIVPLTIELKDYRTILVTVYGAANDTITYTDIHGQTQTIVTDSNGMSTNVAIDIHLNGSTITFTSSVAKSFDNLSNPYTKSIALNNYTTRVNVRPDGAIYWYGVYPGTYQEVKVNGGKTPTVTHNTNYIDIGANGSAGSLWGALVILGSTALSAGNKVRAICSTNVTTSSKVGRNVEYSVGANDWDGLTGQYVNASAGGNVLTKGECTLTGSGYGGFSLTTQNGNTGKLYALWYE